MQTVNYKGRLIRISLGDNLILAERWCVVVFVVKIMCAGTVWLLLFSVTSALIQLPTADSAENASRVRRPASPTEYDRENRNIDHQNNEIVGGLLNVARFHRDPRVVYGAMFLAGIQSNPYLMRVAANILVRYAVLNGTLPVFGDATAASSDYEMSRLIDAIQRVVDRQEFQLDLPETEEYKKEPLAVRLFESGYSRWVEYLKKGSIRFSEPDGQTIDPVPEAADGVEFTTQYILEPISVSEVESSDAVTTTDVGSGEVTESTILHEVYEADEPNTLDNVIENLYVVE